MGLAEDLWLRKSNVITYSPPNVDPTTLDNFLTDWAIHVTNEAIWQCNGLELDAMDLAGLEIGLTVPSMKPKQLSKAAPFAEIASA